MDAFLIAIGCNWFTRKIVKFFLNYEFKILKSKLYGIVSSLTVENLEK